jgi:hypothetical protein
MAEKPQGSHSQQAGDDRREVDAAQPWWRRPIGDAALAGVTATLTVLLAVSSFLSAKAASESDDNYAFSLSNLTDAAFFYEQGFADVTEALGGSLDRNCLLGITNPEYLEVCPDREEVLRLSNLNPAILLANEYQGEANYQIATGRDKSIDAVKYQSALVIFAIGLALSAWASLTTHAGVIRTTFAWISVGALVVGVLRMLSILLTGVLMSQLV